MKLLNCTKLRGISLQKLIHSNLIPVLPLLLTKDDKTIRLTLEIIHWGLIAGISSSVGIGFYIWINPPRPGSLGALTILLMSVGIVITFVSLSARQIFRPFVKRITLIDDTLMMNGEWNGIVDLPNDEKRVNIVFGRVTDKLADKVVHFGTTEPHSDQLPKCNHELSSFLSATHKLGFDCVNVNMAIEMAKRRLRAAQAKMVNLEAETRKGADEISQKLTEGGLIHKTPYKAVLPKS